MNYINTGEINNYLGLLADTALRTIDSAKFIELAEKGSMTKKELANSLCMSRPKLYKNEAVITDKEIQKNIIPFVYIADLAYILFNKDEEKTMKWLMTPNHIFFNTSPFYMAMGGKGDSVIIKLKEWLGVEN